MLGNGTQSARIRRYAAFAALRSAAYMALALLLVFYCTPVAAADEGGGESTEPVVDFGGLNAAIADAQAAAGAYPVIDDDPANVDEGTQYVTSGTLGALQGAIGTAQAVAGNEAASQDEVNAQVSALEGAVGSFYASVLTGAKALTPDPQPGLVINGVSIYLHDTDDCLGTNWGDYTQAYDSVAQKARITQKGGSLELDYVTSWSNGESGARNDATATWWSSDPSIASFNSNRLEAHKDGTVRVRAVADAGKTGGAEVYAEATVAVAGQDDALYVSAVRIIAPGGADVSNGIYQIEDKLSTAQVQFMAEVDVVDPAAGATVTYTTNGQLSKQVPELGDLAWRVSDPSLGSIIEDSGLYRPARYANPAVSVETHAGFGGGLVASSVIVMAIDPDEGEQGDEYHPQDSLAVKAYYGGPDSTGRYHTPAEDGDAAYVVNDTYTLADLQSLGSLTAYYTALAVGSDYYTMQGTGVPLSTVLRESGINIDGIKSFAFTTADWPSGENRPVTASFVFADRFFYPNIDVGSYSDAVQVFPIIAWQSSQVKNSTNLSMPMTEATRFRLLFGATPQGGNSQYQIKWINTLVVVLEGYEAPGDGNGQGTGGGTDPDPDPNANDDGDGQGTAGTGDHQTGGDGGGEGRGEGAGAAATAGTAGGAEAGGQGSADAERGNATEDPDTANPKEAADVEGTMGVAGGRPRNVYQVMNKNASDVEKNMSADNPLAPYTVPLGVLVVGVGGLESLLWFRFQQRTAAVAAHAALAG